MHSTFKTRGVKRKQYNVMNVKCNEGSVPSRKIIGCKWVVKELSEAVGKES